jgi:hypothetical protein
MSIKISGSLEFEIAKELLAAVSKLYPKYQRIFRILLIYPWFLL